MKPDFRMLQALAVASQLGIVLGASVLLGLLGGQFLDGRFGTTPLFMILGTTLGLAGGMLGIVRLAKFFLAAANKKPPGGSSAH